MTARTRHLIDQMALALVDHCSELGSDHDCIRVLIAAHFRPSEIFNHLDTARDLARAARESEADIWDKLMGERT